MFGAKYFATRQRLSDVVGRVRDLAERNDSGAAAPLDENEQLENLRRPLLCVVCGEVNAGKSTLLNGIFGQDLCKVNVLPETDRVHWYRWGEEDKNSDITPTLQERYRDIDFLKDFNIVDTPGTNSVKRGHEAITKRFLPVADLLLFVFPVSNPWGAATWNFIAGLEPGQHRNLIIVLQQADLREKEDLAVIISHMQTLAEKKIGTRPPVFPVSGRLALEARDARPFGQKAWQASGYHELCRHISALVNSSSQRQIALRLVHDSVQDSLRLIEKGIEEKARLLEKDMAFLNELENEVDLAREAHARLFERKFSGLENVFAKVGQEKSQDLSRRVSAFSSLLALFKTERLPIAIEQSLVDAVKNAVEERAALDGEELVAKCRQHWQNVVPRIKERLNLDPPDFDQETASLEETCKKFVTRMGRAARQAVVTLKIRGLLDMQMEGRRLTTRRLVSAALLTVILAGFLGAAQIAVWPFIALVFAAILLAGALWHSHHTGRDVSGVYLEKIDASHHEFVTALTKDYREGVRDFFIEYGSIFQTIRRHIAKQKLALKPQLEEWNELFLELKGIEQEL